MSLVTKVKPLVLVGCSGSGRSAIIYNLTRNLPHKFQRLVSHTTRKPRPREVNNKDFHFVDEQWIKDNQSKFVTLTYSGNGNYYGLVGEEIQRVVKMNKIPIFKMTLDAYTKNLTKQGSLQISPNPNPKPSSQKPFCPMPAHLIKDKKIQCYALYIRIPSMQQLQKRLKFSPFTVKEQAQKIEKAKLEQNEAEKYFQREDIIGKLGDQQEDWDFEETIVRVQSRLFQIY